jgi:ATP-binding cassette subfamily B protein
MYDINYGQILIDGQNIKSWNLANLRRSIGYVPQDVFLFSDTVSGNIALGNPGSTQEEIEKYARYAAVYDDILDLEKGFQTVVGERGVTLSGGQKQRISIARALIKKPSMIVLDDCLSAVDAETEQQIASFLQEVCADATTFIITHRIYQAVKFDKIIVLDNGRMVEYGSPEQVYAQKGYYYEMLEHQSGANQIVA